MRTPTIAFLLFAACGAPDPGASESAITQSSASCLVCPPPGSLACAVKVSSTRYFEVDYPATFKQAVSVGYVGTDDDTVYYDVGSWYPTYGGYLHPFTYYSASTCGAFDKLCFAVNVPNAQGQTIFYRPTAVRIVDRYGNLAAPPLEDLGAVFRCVPKSWW